MEIVRFVCCTRVSASRNFLACVRGCSFRRGAFVARSFSASQSYSKKQDFPSVDGFSPVLESTTDPTLVNELATHGGDLASLGLGGITPVGLLQNMLEMVHVHLGLPWWASIALCTVTMRALMFPLVLHLQKNTIRMNNIRPDMQKMMEKVKEYKAAGNNEMVAVESANLLKLFEKNDCSPAKLFLAPLVQVSLDTC